MTEGDIKPLKAIASSSSQTSIDGMSPFIGLISGMAKMFTGDKGGKLMTITAVNGSRVTGNEAVVDLEITQSVMGMDTSEDVPVHLVCEGSVIRRQWKVDVTKAKGNSPFAVFAAFQEGFSQGLKELQDMPKMPDGSDMPKMPGAFPPMPSK